MRRFSVSLVAVAAALTLGAGLANAADTIKVGVAGPITGQYAAFGDQMKRGAEMAIADINAKGGVLGKQLTLEIGDDACDPKQARAAAEDLAGKGVVFVAGHFCSSSSIPASEVYAEQGVLQISPASTNPAFTEGAAEKGWTTVFRTCGRDDAQGKIAGQYLATHYKDKNVAIIHDKSTYGKGIADETKKVMNQLGLQEKMYEAINADDKDFSALITKMKAEKIDVIYGGLYHPAAALLIRQAKEQGLDVQLLGEDAYVTNEFWSIAGDAAEGVMMTFGPDPRNMATAKEVVEEFKKQNYDPEGYTLYTYAAFQVWAQAAEKAGTTDAEKVAEQIHGHVFPTVLGHLSFDEKGDIKNPAYVWYQWSKGQYK
ncbi:MAG: branched-chain amino acid ABC transporter substrate-binding protein, partial [Rhodospirillaceae bacterium]|nr:branched-chain amino acid ABC transporter substrate-binding protein [Rhodospirillaceae bacterium]